MIVLRKELLLRELVDIIMDYLDKLFDIAIICDAISHGWSEDQKLWGKPSLLPPNHFTCANWTTLYKKIYNGKIVIYVPDHIYDPKVRKNDIL